MLYRTYPSTPWTLVVRFVRSLALRSPSVSPQSIESVNDRTLADLALHRVDHRARRVMIP